MSENMCEQCGTEMVSVWERQHNLMSTAGTDVYMGERCENQNCLAYMEQPMA